MSIAAEPGVIATENHTQRVDAARQVLRERGADALLLTFLPDIRWVCGFSGSNGILIVLPDEAHFVTDGRYLVQAHREVRGASVHVPGYQLLEHASNERLLGAASVVLVQGDHLTVSQMDELRSQFPDVQFEPATDLLVPYVGRKDDEEVRLIREAQSITDSVFDHLLNILLPGMTEKEIAAEIVYQHLIRGAEGISFSPIVAAGPQGALPHARPTDRPIGPHELLVLDMGCFLNGYASDMTRTIAIGTPTEEARKVYSLVLEAQERAIDAAHAGMTSIELDGVARRVIQDGGYGEYFSHGLGHGLGLQIHEWPKVSYHVQVDLPAGAVVTIEPGVYLPDRFGVRIEDIIVLRDDGCENLTNARKDLVVL
jgi:Xaa-Pro aminopeptidase